MARSNSAKVEPDPRLARMLDEHKSAAPVLDVDKQRVTYHASVQEFLATSRREPIVPENRKHKFLKDKNVAETSGVEWYGLPEGHTPKRHAVFQTCDGIAENGWQEGADRIKQSLSALRLPHGLRMPSPRRKATWGDMGEEVCMDRVRAGNLDTAFRTVRRREVPRPPMMQIAVHVGGSSRLKADDFFWRGAAATFLADVMVSTGYNVEIFATFAGTLDHYTLGAGEVYSTIDIVKVKDARAPYSIAHIAACTAHCGVFRTLGLRTKVALAPVEVSSGISTTDNAMADSIMEARKPNGARLFIISDQINSEKAAQDYINSTLSDLIGSRAA